MGERNEEEGKRTENASEKEEEKKTNRTCSGVARFLQSAPGVTIEGLSRMPSKMVPWSAMYLKKCFLKGSKVQK